MPRRSWPLPAAGATRRCLSLCQVKTPVRKKLWKPPCSWPPPAAGATRRRHPSVSGLQRAAAASGGWQPGGSPDASAADSSLANWGPKGDAVPQPLGCRPFVPSQVQAAGTVITIMNNTVAKQLRTGIQHSQM